MLAKKVHENIKSTFRREINVINVIFIMSVLALALTLTHFNIVINKTSCFRSKTEKKDL